jgi:hypothetical protein
MNAEVTDFINKLNEKAGQEWQAEVCTQLRQLANQSIPDVSERIQYGKPHFLKDGKYAAVLGTAKGWVTFTIFNAEGIEGPDNFFEEGPPERKTVKILKGKTPNYDLIGKLLKQAAQA